CDSPIPSLYDAPVPATFLRLRIDLIGHQQIAERPPVAAPDTAPQLIELCESETVGAIHDHRVRVGHIESRFDDHCRDENVDLAADEPAQHGPEILPPHL